MFTALLLSSLTLSEVFSTSINYCTFSKLQNINLGTTISESDPSYFYLDVENYNRPSVTNLSRIASSNFSIVQNFGSMFKVFNDGTQQTYSAYAMSFHVPAVHMVNNVQNALEIMIHHTGPGTNSSGLVLAFLFSDTMGTNSSIVTFFNDLNNTVTGTNTIDPVDLSGDGYYYLKEFYYSNNPGYDSSNCGNMEWVIYSDVIYIDSQLILQYTLNQFITNSSPLGASYQTITYTNYSGQQVEFSLLIASALAFLLV